MGSDWNVQGNFLRKYKKSFLSRKYKKFFNLRVRKFHFSKYKEFFFAVDFLYFLGFGLKGASGSPKVYY